MIGPTPSTLVTVLAVVDRRGDAAFELDEVGVNAANLAEELEGESAAFDTGRVGGLDAAQLDRGPVVESLLGSPPATSWHKSAWR